MIAPWNIYRPDVEKNLSFSRSYDIDKREFPAIRRRRTPTIRDFVNRYGLLASQCAEDSRFRISAGR
jgi:hypothetical protein